MTHHHVYYAHGKGTGPRGHKSKALLPIAEQAGFAVESIDFTATEDPDERVAMLLEHRPQATGRLVLVGSSMGGYVMANAADELGADGLFLLAPAIGIPGYPAYPAPTTRHQEIVHGWRDALIPPPSVVTYAERQRARLHLLDAEHDLNDHLPTLQRLFADFLQRVAG
ncbi:YqiA/YcfP family alpha/beta fold hydrolase [Halorhodospira halophila]|uniref:Serine aminopeptidase S33 domain-containing protein n=1 Tax=Halorhodospira halophila (strain DSM 244 / SL1) TaxID=349124 RepID=A1WY28_HALHL|nr:YqiA/YcfP family alpha/beta fold hydrolase [Halorhodospira halophila]ABM62590.1 conserved hypothetical protein [Halorhodospira halophila SL1]MBK1728269.1 hypothetical protein [Halorhodospira halophila]